MTPPDQDWVISEKPYVRLLGPIQYSSHYRCHTAMAQVNDALCIIEVRMNERRSTGGGDE